ISTCSVNHMTPSRSKYKKEFHDRRKYDLDKFRTWLRLSTDELKKVANEFARKLNHSKSPVKVIVPLQGWSSVDSLGSPTYDPEEDRVFVDALRSKLDSRIEIIEIDANMEDATFSQQVIKSALELF
ncbi:MAG TPA: UPF0261 family protein, partial [Bacteroidetes bacterium]|nr:UPF0261 family protein [Bacteroidota bacterium]